MDEPLNQGQVNFLRRVAAAIPRLFAALEEGNVKSELILGLRRVRSRQARLKLVAELVDPGNNPLETHGAKDMGRESVVQGEPSIQAGPVHQGIPIKPAKPVLREQAATCGKPVEPD